MLDSVQIHEVFESLQGESTFAGLTCHFIRLAGCALRCVYCDTPAARADTGRCARVVELVAAAAASRAAIIEITGGEPLEQAACPGLASRLREACAPRPVLIETNGACDLTLVPAGVVAIMDVKTPGSGEAARFREANIACLRPYDEVKFVLCDRADYDWARARADAWRLAQRCRAVHFSAAAGRLDPRALAGWLRADGGAYRLGLQWHRSLEIP